MKFGKLNPKSWYNILHSAGKPNDKQVKPRLSMQDDHRHGVMSYRDWDDLCSNATKIDDHVIHENYTTTHDCLLDECKYAKLHMPHGLGKFPALYCVHPNCLNIYINPEFKDEGTYIKIYYPRPEMCPLNGDQS